MIDITHPDTFHGLPVHTLALPDGPETEALPEADAVAWRLDCQWDESEFEAVWQRFLTSVDPGRVRALLIGPWWEEDYVNFSPVVEAIVSDAHRFPALRALFLADVESEECEISWLEMCDITPVLEALPLLEELTVRGCGSWSPEEEQLRLRPVRHQALRSLRFESGGLPGHVVSAVGACDLPALEHLEFWFGSESYGGDATVADLAPVLSGAALPRLRHLGLQNSEIQDEIAAAVASAPVVARLDSLALSMGTLGDTGAQALLEGQPLVHLSALDLRHHYLSAPFVSRIQDLCARAGVRVDLDEAEDWDPEDDESRYVAVSE
ncbi:STM4015 family protein [Streptomyces sp. NBC_00059]|uniref:STM4015 family protein n=1 Tax=Streptomyces sp. NBC_00059 TaxID=2975635 RepID=UPI002251A7DA|nr:STM4015 family protein [Streptomyces sp. NBC_00059]MCX5415503.1 STM4015 family protein [Streptomyces sp. NBC_00059]